MIWFELVINNVMHTILFQGAKPTYNPGLIANCLLLLPYGTWTLLTGAGFFSATDWALSILLGLAIVAFFGTKTRGRVARLRTMGSTAVASDAATNRKVSLVLQMGERYINRALDGTGVTRGTAPLLVQLRDIGSQSTGVANPQLAQCSDALMMNSELECG